MDLLIDDIEVDEGLSLAVISNRRRRLRVSGSAHQARSKAKGWQQAFEYLRPGLSGQFHEAAPLPQLIRWWATFNLHDVDISTTSRSP